MAKGQLKNEIAELAPSDHSTLGIVAYNTLRSTGNFTLASAVMQVLVGFEPLKLFWPGLTQARFSPKSALSDQNALMRKSDFEDEFKSFDPGLGEDQGLFQPR